MIENSVSVIIPAYNEEAVILEFLLKLKSIMLTNFKNYEIIVVNDGSTDNTLKMIEDQKDIAIISHPYNKGNGATVRTGIRAATKDFVIMLDSDGQHDVNDIIPIAELLSTYDCVIGARTDESDGSLHRNTANKIYNLFASYMTGMKIKDLTSGFRGFRRNVIKQFLYLFPNGFSYPTTSTLAVIKAGYNLTFFPIKAQKRVGKSKIKIFRDGGRFFMIIIKITSLFSPLKIFLPVSLLFIASGFAHMIYKIFIMNGKYTQFSVFLITAGILFFLIGLVSEQITSLRYSRINEEN